MAAVLTLRRPPASGDNSRLRAVWPACWVGCAKGTHDSAPGGDHFGASLLDEATANGLNVQRRIGESLSDVIIRRAAKGKL
jgi:hypothetical protein